MPVDLDGGAPAWHPGSMDLRLTFLFYLAALVCFAVAAFGGQIGGGRRSVGLVPVGLALWLFPLLWTTGTTAF